MRGIVRHYHQVDADLAAAARQMVNRRGVPKTVDAVLDLSADLLPAMLEGRRFLHAREIELVAADFPHLVMPQNPAFYPVGALAQEIARCAGLTPGPDLDIPRELTPKEIRQAARAARQVVIDSDDSLDTFINSLTAGMGRHARAASRDAIIRAAQINRRKWARQVNGPTCAFCSILAARGAVYTRHTAKFKTHNKCDCTATIVEGAEWDGKKEAQRLARHWAAAKGDLEKFKKMERIA